MSRYSDTLTYEAILNEMLAQVPDTVDKREGSVIYDALAPAAMELAQVYILLDVIFDETFVDTASLQYLMLRAREIGVPIQEATQAVVRGVFDPPGLEIPEGSRFNCGTVNYVVDEKISDGVYRLICETAGSAGNLDSGVLLPIDSIQGLKTAELAGVLIPAVDTDNADTLREKYYKYVRSRAFGGNIAHYKQWLEGPNGDSGISGIGGVKVYPVWQGIGTVKVQFIVEAADPETGEIDYRPPTTDHVAQIQEYLDPVAHHGEGYGVAPVGHTVTVEGVQPDEITVTCSITFEGGAGKTAEEVIAEALAPYLMELRKSWADEDETVVKASQIMYHILNLPDGKVKDVDIASVTINGQRGNYTLAPGHVPVMPGEGGGT